MRYYAANMGYCVYSSVSNIVKMVRSHVLCHADSVYCGPGLVPNRPRVSAHRGRFVPRRVAARPRPFDSAERRVVKCCRGANAAPCAILAQRPHVRPQRAKNGKVERELRSRRYSAEFRGITDERKLSPRSPGPDGAFLMGFRDAACFVMAAGLRMLAVTLALQPLLKAKATITGALEAVYAFADAEGNDALCLRLVDKGAYVLDCDVELCARMEEHSLRGDTVDVLFANGETLQVACDGEVLFRQEGVLLIGAGYALAGGIMAVAGCALWIFLRRTIQKKQKAGRTGQDAPKDVYDLP